MQIFIFIFGFGTTLLASFTFIPQVIKTLKTKMTVNISLLSLVIYTIANLLWLIFGILSLTISGLSGDINVAWSLTLIIPYSVTILCTLIVMWVKISNLLQKRRLDRVQNEDFLASTLKQNI